MSTISFVAGGRYPRETSIMAAPCPLLGHGIADDTLLHLFRFLPTARDLLCLQLTCPRFATKLIAAPDGCGGAAATAPEMLCLVEEAARQWLAGCSEQGYGLAPHLGLESWLSLMHEVELLRLPAAFGRAHGSVTLSEGDC